jgi:putative ABC transport system permease protein
MNILATCLTAIQAMFANKLRSALTMLGVVIGVAAVITLMSIGQGVQQEITGRISSLGSNLVFVRSGETQDSRGLEQQALTLVDADAEAINNPERYPYVIGVAAQTSAVTGTLTYAGTSDRTVLIGVTPEYQYVREFYVEHGRFITQADVDRKGLVAVLGSGTKERLFGAADPLGKTFRLSVGQSNFVLRVVGVMESKGATIGGDEDDLVFLPLPTMQARIPSQRHPQGLSNVSQITVRLQDKKYADQAKDDITRLLTARHGEEDFIIRTQDELVSTITQISRTITIFLGSIAGISLLVGGIGIMNIMLVSVTERTREIGLRKAVGARRRDILMQFMVEAVTVTMVGGAIGVVIGVGGAALTDGRHLGTWELNTAVTPLSIIIAFAVSAAVGLFFGIYPAYSAAGMDPIEALRHE